MTLQLTQRLAEGKAEAQPFPRRARAVEQEVGRRHARHRVRFTLAGLVEGAWHHARVRGGSITRGMLGELRHSTLHQELQDAILKVHSPKEGAGALVLPKVTTEVKGEALLDGGAGDTVVSVVGHRALILLACRTQPLGLVTTLREDAGAEVGGHLPERGGPGLGLQEEARLPQGIVEPLGHGGVGCTTQVVPEV